MHSYQNVFAPFSMAFSSQSISDKISIIINTITGKLLAAHQLLINPSTVIPDYFEKYFRTVELK